MAKKTMDPKKKAERVAKARKDHPRGHCLLSRDNPHNRNLFPNGPFGNEDVAVTICPSPDRCPHYHYTYDARDSPGFEETPIHVLAASYRDRLCGRTLHNAFQHAKNPNRVYIRVIEQTEPNSDLVDDAGCFEHYCEKYNPNCQEYKDQVRIVPVNSKESKGPTWARSKLSAMIHWDYVHRNISPDLDFQPVQLNDFCMQIDSHMDFSDNWDVELVDMFHMTENDYAVLSTYVTDIEANNQDPTNVPHLCMVQFTSSIRNWGTKECNFLIKPKLTNAMWGAGLSFHRCHAELNVPVDPYLDNVFDGEEGSRGIRFFTHGYDVYTPHRVLVTHDYHTHQSNPVVHTWGRGRNKVSHETNFKFMDEIETHRERLFTFGSERVNMMIGIGTTKKKEETELIRKTRFGIGNKRTLDQAVEFTGINLKEKKMAVNKCGNLNWVPYEESSNYGVGEILSRSNAGETTKTFAISSTSGAGEMFNPGDELLVTSTAKNEVITDSALQSSYLAPVAAVILVFALFMFFTTKKDKDERHKK